MERVRLYDEPHSVANRNISPQSDVLIVKFCIFTRGRVGSPWPGGTRVPAVMRILKQTFLANSIRYYRFP